MPLVRTHLIRMAHIMPPKSSHKRHGRHWEAWFSHMAKYFSSLSSVVHLCTSSAKITIWFTQSCGYNVKKKLQSTRISRNLKEFILKQGESSRSWILPKSIILQDLQIQNWYPNPYSEVPCLASTFQPHLCQLQGLKPPHWTKISS